MNRHIRRLFLFVVIVGCVSLANAQPARRDFNRPRTYDVEHYTIRVNFDRPAKKVLGETTITFKPLKDGFTTADFDEVGLKFSSVTLDPAGTILKYKNDASGIHVALDRPYKASETISIKFVHTATPKKGVYFVDEEKEGDKLIHSAQIWTQGEADEARHWFPSFDFPSDKATFDQFITAMDGETVVSNGEEMEEAKNADGTVTHHFRINFPTPVYLISFVIGKYAKVSDKYREVPLGFYVYPGTESIVPKAYGTTKDMMRVFEELTGVDFPYPKYDQSIVAKFTFGGMENITATTMADSEIFFAQFELTKPTVHDLVSHELSHSWFGDLVTCKNWAELWLNEGFATFMEAAFREKMYGRRNYLIKVERDAEDFIADEAVNKKRNALFNQRADAVSELFDRPATIYNKGGAVLHTLREEIGDAAFWKGVNLYLTRHRFGNVESTDLRSAMEEASGRDLDWFFDQWVYGAGYPKLDVEHIWNEKTKTLRLTVKQMQKADGITPSTFRLPMNVEFTTASGKTTEPILISKKSETFSMKLSAKPTAIKFDPEMKIPIKTVKLVEPKK
jgi:aminopeptidase N